MPTAIAKGRTFLINEFQGPVHDGCHLPQPPDPSAYYCGGWNYDEGIGRSDESNTGYAMFGLQLTGGVPVPLLADNINWLHHIQEINTNPFATRNDGGGDYQPGINSGDFSSSANDTGSMIFGLGYDNVPISDPHVVAGLFLGQDVLDVYELEQPTDNMVYHGGLLRGGPCMIGSLGCQWFFAGSEGGFHYSLFALAKGLGAYIPPVLSDQHNWYAKLVDLLLTQQNTNGSWPQDGRDDATPLFATALSVGSLGLVGVPGDIEICKASDPNHPVTGSFTFTATTPGFNSGPIVVPVGQCSGSIQVPSGAVTVAETPKLGVAVSNVTAFAYDELGFYHDELNSWIQPDLHAIVNVMAGDVDEETLVTFTNYAAPPGLLKLCKIAGDPSTLGQVFTFTVTGGGQRHVYMVTAGPPEQGGNCVLAGNFPVNTPVMIAETPKPPFFPSMITVNEGQLMPCTPSSVYCTIVTVIPGITQVTFTNTSTVLCDGQNLLTNGSFETGDFTGWTQGGNTGDTSVVSGPYYRYSGAQAGAFYAVLGPVGSPGSLRQRISTIPGQPYHVCFWLNAVGDNPSFFNGYWDTPQFVSLTNPLTRGWTRYVYGPFTGTGNDTLMFTFRDDPGWIALDNVSVVYP